MALNPALLAVLKAKFGEVRVSNQGIRRVEERRPGKKTPDAIERGEHYNFNCPICGDQHFRASVSYRWLQKENSWSSNRITALAHCYNEGCALWSPKFWEPLVEDLQRAELGVALGVYTQDEPVVRESGPIKLPTGLVSIADLPPDHEAVRFLLNKYNGLTPSYLATGYNVMYGAEVDPLVPRAQGRIIFPIYAGNQVVAWQGRAVRNDVDPRWLLPTGFSKSILYNADNVAPTQPVVICEGITSAISSGPNAVAIFGKSLNRARASKITDKWKSIVVATDPDTFVPDNRPGGGGKVWAQILHQTLGEFVQDVRLVRWPKDVLELARRKITLLESDITVPDAADIGIAGMRDILKDIYG